MAGVFAGTRGNPSARILIVGEGYGMEDVTRQEAFCGNAGHELSNILAEAGILETDCLFTNCVNMRIPSYSLTPLFFDNKTVKESKLTDYKGLYPKQELIKGLQQLYKLIETLKPRLIIAAGNLPLWALTDNLTKVGRDAAYGLAYKVPTGIGNYRGSMLRTSKELGAIPLLPIHHPITILRSWELRPITVMDLRRRVAQCFKGNWDEPALNFLIRPDIDTVMSTLMDLKMRAEFSKQPLRLSVDIETLSHFISCVGIAWSEFDALCIPFMCTYDKEGYWRADEEEIITITLRELLTHPNVSIVGQNFSYDMQYFNRYMFCIPKYVDDTMLAHHVCFPGTPMGLDYLSSMYCEHHVFWKEDSKEALKVENDDEYWIYNCRDCVKTYEIMNILEQQHERYNLKQQYDIQMRRVRHLTGCLGPAGAMMIRGVAIDSKRRIAENMRQIEAISELEILLQSLVPEDCVEPLSKKKAPWWSSPTQLAELFYITLGCKAIKNRKTGQVTTNDEALTKLGDRYPVLKPLTDTLAQYRSMSVFGSFINMKLGFDGRMRCSYSPTTETFRYRSSSDVFGSGGNLQNLPKGTEEE